MIDIKAIEAAAALSRAANTRANTDDFAIQVTRDHRTIQQLMFGLMWKCIVAWSRNRGAGTYDARNEATVKLCARIVDAVGEDQRFPYI